MMPQPRPAPTSPEPPIVISDEARRMIVSLSARGVVATEACLRDPESAECREAKAEEDREIAALSRYVGGLEGAARDVVRHFGAPFWGCSLVVRDVATLRDALPSEKGEDDERP